MVSSSVRILGWGRRSGTVSSLIAPPFHRSTRRACGSGSSRRSVMFTSPGRVRSSCLRSLSVVVGASQTAPRSSPSARIAARSCSERALGRAAPRRGGGGLAAGELGLGVGVLAEGLFPFGFQAAGDQPVVRVDGPVAALGPGRVVAGLLHLAVPLGEGGVVAVFELPGGGQAGLQRGGGERGQECFGDGGVDGLPADVHVPGAAAVDQVAGTLAVVVWDPAKPEAGSAERLVCDRDVTGGGIDVEFFGEKARMMGGAAALAAQTGAALMPVILWFEGDHWGVHVHEEIPVPAEGDRKQQAMMMMMMMMMMMQDVARLFEAGIRAHPQDWHMLQRVFVADLDPERLRRAAGS